jgi:sodium/hydrogen antiporter
MTEAIPWFFLLIFGYCLIYKRLSTTPLTGPIVFTLAGALAIFAIPGWKESMPEHGAFLTLAEVGLVMVLFTDASRTDLKVLKRIKSLPTRLLTVGLLLTMVLGALLAKLIFTELTAWEACILACILAPTDAGLGQVIVESEKVPLAIRQALNVEAGLNDGLSVPFLMFAIAMTAETEMTSSGGQRLAKLIYEQLALGVVLGLGIGLLGGWLLGKAVKADWASRTPLALMVLPVCCITLSEPMGASMFITAFVAGLAVQSGFPQASKTSIEFIEDWGQLINWGVFAIFGCLMAQNWNQITGKDWLYAILSLTVVRMLPVALSLSGSGLTLASKLFVGWFGPRGLASIVLALVCLEQDPTGTWGKLLMGAVLATVFLSIFAHGLSAEPGIAAYQKSISHLGPDKPEHREI